jgi:tetratricopeptide (TPR) repeat protein
MEQSSNNLEKSLEIDNIFYHGEKLREKSFYPESLRLFKKALQGYTKICDRDGIFYCMLSLGDTYRMVGNFDLAAKSYANAIELAKKIKDPIKAADAKVGLGLSLRAEGKWKEAIKLIRESRKTYQRKGDSHGLAFTLWAEAGALRIKGNIIGAIKMFKESYKIFKSLKDIQGAGYCLCGLGGTSRIAGRFRDSLKYYTSAHRLFSDIKDIFGTAYSYCGIGNAHRMRKDYKSALANFAKAIRLYKKIGDRVSYSYTLWSLGTTYKMIGTFNKARDNFIKAMLLFKKTKDPRGIVYCRLGLGEIAFLKGKKAIAKRQILASLCGSSKNSFAVEKCHATTLMSYMNKNNPPCPPLLKGCKEKFSEKIDNGCYNRLGLKLGFQGLPFNIP